MKSSRSARQWLSVWERVDAKCSAQLEATRKSDGLTDRQAALKIAKNTHLDGLAIDAIHMLAFVDTPPIEQLK